MNSSPEPKDMAVPLNKIDLTISADMSEFSAALELLKQRLELAPEVVERFLNGVDSLSQLCSVDAGDSPAAGAGELRIMLQPSDCFREFLAATSTGNVDGVAV